MAHVDDNEGGVSFKEKQDFIIKNLKELKDGLEWNASLSSFMPALEIFSRDDVEELDAIPVRGKRNQKFFMYIHDKLPGKPGLYKNLIELLDSKDLLQSGVAAVLKRVYPKEETNISTCSRVFPTRSSTEVSADTVDGLFEFFRGKRPKIEYLHKFVHPMQVKVVSPSTPMNFPDDYYRLPTSDKGLALIVNILQYRDGKNNRFGGALDSYYMSNLLNQLGHEIDYHSDYEKDFTEKWLDEIIINFKKACVDKKVKSVVVFLGGHGAEARLYLPDGKLYAIYEKIVYKLCDSSDGFSGWSQIPKIFFVNACRDVADKPQEIINHCGIFQSCLPGTSSYRNEVEGSYFVRALTEIVMNEAHRLDLETMMTLVKDKVLFDTSHLNHFQQPMPAKIGEIGKLYFNIDV